MRSRAGALTGRPLSAPDQWPREHSAPPAGGLSPEATQYLASHPGLLLGSQAGHLCRPLGRHHATSGQLPNVSWSKATRGMRGKEVPGSVLCWGWLVLGHLTPQPSQAPQERPRWQRQELPAGVTRAQASAGTLRSCGEHAPRPPLAWRLAGWRQGAGKEHPGVGRWQHLCGEGWRPESGPGWVRAGGPEQVLNVIRAKKEAEADPAPGQRSHHSQRAWLGALLCAAW